MVHWGIEDKRGVYNCASRVDSLPWYCINVQRDVLVMCVLDMQQAHTIQME